MCGIAGIISLTSNKINLTDIVAMTEEILSRGPDGLGFLTNEFEDTAIIKSKYPSALHLKDELTTNFAFSHSRLSIIDLSDNAAMPMTDSSNGYWITYNGEIYNHAELKQELQLLGAIFKTNSDTEVILNAYKYWGIACLKRFIGMFAFVIYDKKANLFYVVRDRMGVKPLYYTIFNNQFYFSSSLKSLLAIKGIPKKLCPEGVNDYFSYYSSPAPYTIVKDFFKLAPANYICIQDGVVKNTVEYWNVLYNNRKEINEEKEAVEAIKESIFSSVKHRMVADVPMGCMLSGGLDSSSNLALMNQLSNKPINTYSVGFENSKTYTNENYYSNLAAKKFNTNHNQINITGSEFFSTYKQLIEQLDEPIFDTACVPLYIISKLAKQHGVKVLIGGEGADELQIGYSLWTKMNNFNASYKAIGKNLYTAGYNVAKKVPLIKSKLKHHQLWIERLTTNKVVFKNGFNIFYNPIEANIFSTEFKNRLALNVRPDIADELYENFVNFGGNSLLNFMSYMDIKFRLPEVLLARLDKCMMMNGVEARDVYVDHNFAELSMKINPQLKIKNKVEKYLLKKAFKNIVPNEIIKRPKASFIVPIQDLFESKKSKIHYKQELLNFNANYNLFDNAYLTNDLFLNDAKKSFAFITLKDWLLANNIIN